MEKCLLILTSTDARVIVVADGTPHRTTSPTLHACVMSLSASVYTPYTSLDTLDRSPYHEDVEAFPTLPNGTSTVCSRGLFF